MTTKQKCLLLYSYKDISETGSAMTCVGYRHVTDNHPELATAPEGTIYLVHFDGPRYTETYTDKHGQPLPDNIHVWNYTIID